MAVLLCKRSQVRRWENRLCPEFTIFHVIRQGQSLKVPTHNNVAGQKTTNSSKGKSTLSSVHKISGDTPTRPGFESPNPSLFTKL